MAPIEIASVLLAPILLPALLAAGCSHQGVYKQPRKGTVVIRLADEASSVAECPVDAPSARGGRLIVATLADERAEEHKAGMSSWVEEHDGLTAETMTSDRAYSRSVTTMVSDCLAEALAATGRFDQVIRADHEQPGEADLVVSGRLRRMRGWQAYRVEQGPEVNVIESMGDVFLDDLVVKEAGTGRVLFLGQAGAMLEEVPQVVDPYAVAHHAVAVAVTTLADQVRCHPLDRALHETVMVGEDATGDLDDLLDALPDGWSGQWGELTQPAGWDGASACPALSMVDTSRVFFHPRLGHYQPRVDVWLCPPGWEGEMRISEDQRSQRYPARVAGHLEDGRVLLWLTIGKTSWPTAPRDLVAYLRLSSPRFEPVLSLPLETHDGKLDRRQGQPWDEEFHDDINPH